MMTNDHRELVYAHNKYINQPFIVISGTSAGGKTTFVKDVANVFSDQLQLLIKHTDRIPRIGEKDGRDYYFISSDVFDEILTGENSLIIINRYGHKYALCTKEVERALQKEKRPIFILDPNAAIALKTVYSNSILFFIAPKSIKVVEKRILARNEEEEEKKKRLVLLEEEYRIRQLFDYNIYTDNGIDIIRDLLR